MLHRQRAEKAALKLHPNTLDILFKHKSEIFRKLGDIRGLHYIDHIAITIINPNNEIVVFSITPSVEFNLVLQGIWEFDLSFNPKYYTDSNIVFWDKFYGSGYVNRIKEIKEIQHNFTLGFNLIRKIEDFNIIYTFATRHNHANLKQYYMSIVGELFALGDYGYKLLRNLYIEYSEEHPPLLIDSPNNAKKIKKHLKLIINN